MNDRKALEREIHEWLSYRTVFSIPLGIIEEAIHGWLDKQAEITRQECVDDLPSVVNFTQHFIFELERAELKAQIVGLKDQLEKANKARDSWHDKWVRRNQDYDLLASKNDKLKAECDRYRELFNKTLDYAGEIIDLGMELDEGLA